VHFFNARGPYSVVRIVKDLRIAAGYGLNAAKADS